jgi:Uncharacterized conserved protein (DUF2075)
MTNSVNDITASQVMDAATGEGYAPVLEGVKRSYYAASVREFLSHSSEHIIGTLSAAGGDAERSQLYAWGIQIQLLKEALKGVDVRARIYFEYVIPRLGKRVDCILLLGNLLFVLEFKVGETYFDASALDQVWDYALDLKNFHETSHFVPIAPLLVATEAVSVPLVPSRTIHKDSVLLPLCVGKGHLGAALENCLDHFVGIDPIDASAWERGRYLPTPTIVEAARALYAGHDVQEISRSDAGATNLKRTSRAIDRIIAESRRLGLKSICFVTGVPGAGKTLVGLDVANRHMDVNSTLYSVFLSGNGPLVAVLREALSRDLVQRTKTEGGLRKKEAMQRVSAFIQNVHHFRDECLADSGRPPVEHVALFDEAQRAWDRPQTRAFMTRKKGWADFDQSEPEFLISCLDRHPDWATVICLVGGGQEINTGEAGIGEWVDALCRRFTDWHIHISPELRGTEYRAEEILEKLAHLPNIRFDSDLHLAVSMRSFRAETVSQFVKLMLDLDGAAARQALRRLEDRYPIMLTRSVEKAKRWLRAQARGSERYGLVVSSQALRLKPHAIDVRVKTDPVHWFLGDKKDTRSSYYLEDIATEFQVQGLELDWVGVVWDGDLRFSATEWKCHEFLGTDWRNIRKEERRRYLVNAYRVLMTRARQGMVIVVPDGDDEDPTRARAIYDSTFGYFKSLGLTEVG